MAGSYFGTIFRIETFGESHGEGIGVVVDGCPAGLTLNEEIIQAYLNRRKPGTTKYSTPRKEGDKVEILSGIFEGKTTGTPISMLVRNETQRSKDYSEIAGYYRPGHADYTLDCKYGFRDYRGGGRSSGRETIGRVAAGAIAKQLLSELGISVTAYAKKIGPVEIDYASAARENIAKSPLSMPDLKASEKAEEFLMERMEQKDSAGGIIECVVGGLKAGVGEPVFEKLDANLAKAVMSIGAVKGVEIGSGFGAAGMAGHEQNDSFFLCKGEEWGDNLVHQQQALSSQCPIGKKTNHAGGILGGISDGSEIVLRAAVKPTPSIAMQQETVGQDLENCTVSIKGRHDPIIVPRAVVVVEAMTAVTILDQILLAMSSKLSDVKKVYSGWR